MFEYILYSFLYFHWYPRYSSCSSIDMDIESFFWYRIFISIML